MEIGFFNKNNCIHKKTNAFGNDEAETRDLKRLEKSNRHVIAISTDLDHSQSSKPYVLMRSYEFCCEFSRSRPKQNVFLRVSGRPKP